VTRSSGPASHSELVPEPQRHRRRALPKETEELTDRDNTIPLRSPITSNPQSPVTSPTASIVSSLSDYFTIEWNVVSGDRTLTAIKGSSVLQKANDSHGRTNTGDIRLFQRSTYHRVDR